MAPIPVDSPATPALAACGLLCLAFVTNSFCAVLFWRQKTALEVKLKRCQAKLRRVSSKEVAEARARDAHVVTLVRENEDMQMQMLLQRRRNNDALRGKWESEETWLKERAVLRDLFSNRSGEIFELRAILGAMKADHTRRTAEDDICKVIEAKHEKEILELRDRLSEYHHRLTSGGHLDPLLYRPLCPDPHYDDYSDSFTRESRRSRSDNTAVKRGGRGYI